MDPGKGKGRRAKRESRYYISCTGAGMQCFCANGAGLSLDGLLGIGSREREPATAGHEPKLAGPIHWARIKHGMPVSLQPTPPTSAMPLPQTLWERETTASLPTCSCAGRHQQHSGWHTNNVISALQLLHPCRSRAKRGRGTAADDEPAKEDIAGEEQERRRARCSGRRVHRVPITSVPHRSPVASKAAPQPPGSAAVAPYHPAPAAALAPSLTWQPVQAGSLGARVHTPRHIPYLA
jgi:hypothetical protein